MGQGAVAADRGGQAIGQVVYQRAELAGQPVRVAPRPMFMVGRDDLLAGLAARLTGNAGDGPRVAALCGLGGAGKTSMAVEYAHRQLGRLGLVWQIPAEDPAAMAAELGELAALLGARDLLDTRSPVAAVHAELAARTGGWLLIFDNASDAAAVAHVLPPAGDGQVIITSRSAHWSGSTAIEVPVLDAATAAGFLTVRTGDPDLESARELAAELGGLPLALEQAAAYITAAGRDLAGYLDLYRDRQADLLDRGDPAGYDQRVTTTWSVSLSRLRDDAPAAAGLLSLLACCAPDTIPYRLLLQIATPPGPLPPEAAALLGPLLDDALAVDDATTALRRYSLISAPSRGLVSVHRLVQAITLAHLPDELADAWRQAAAILITAALPGDPEEPATWPVFAVLLPHVLAILPLISEPVERVVTYIGRSGSYLAARDLQKQISAARKGALGPEHPDTLAACANLAFWTGAAGDAAGARDQFAALLPVVERALGPKHPQTLSARGNLARWAGEAGDEATARDQYAALLPVVERALGPGHPGTLTARANLAYSTGAAGDAAAARDQFAALLPIVERAFGPEHPETLTTRDNLANWTARAGDAAGGRDHLAALLPVRERVFSAEHPETLTIRVNLARCVGEAGDAVAARDQYAALLPIVERVFGLEHPNTLTARGDFAHWTGAAGDAAGARDQFAALLPVCERVLSGEHPLTLDARSDLAYWTGRAGECVGGS